MDQDPNEHGQLKKQGLINRGRSKMDFLAVYGSMAAPKCKGAMEMRNDDCLGSHTISNAQKDTAGPLEALELCGRNKCYYKKRRYRCPGKRRYKVKTNKRCCTRKYSSKKINLCNRNWTRISIHPFINFLRRFRRKFSSRTPPSEIASKGRCAWNRMSCRAKQNYYEQAKRARIRGYRT